MPISRRRLLQGAAALGTLARSSAAPAREMAPDGFEGQGAITPMRPYIGAATSRIDGRAKVTGAAKYAGEFNVPNLVYGFVLESTIAKGRIVRIEARNALQVKGVSDVLTHQNRPPLADADKDWKDDTAPERGAPFRPLYDDRILFSRQPVALVLAEDWDTARFAARSFRSSTKMSQASRTSSHNAIRPLMSRNRRSRAAKPPAPLRLPTYAMMRNILYRPSTTIPWSSTRRPRYGTRAAS